MADVRCSACSKLLRVKDELVGKTIACPCGNKFQVSESESKVVLQNTGGITVSCECGKKLKAPANAAGKAVRCPCGATVAVPANQPKQSAPQPAMAAAAAPAAQTQPAQAPADDWLSGLPTGEVNAGGGSGSYAAAPAYTPPPANPYQNSPQQMAAPAEAAWQEQPSQQSSGGSVFNASTGMGLLMMIGALVWFFGALAAGRIFFYPPILFLIGLFKFFSGLFNRE